MITPRDIARKTMTPEKKKEAKKSLFGYYIGRPISYIFTIPFLYINVSPNVITIISIIFSIAGFVFISFGQNIVFRIIGMVFFFMWNIFDGVDGNVARYKGIKTENGDFLDTLGGYLSMCLILLSLGNASFYDTNSNIYFPKELPIILSGLSAMFTLIPRVLAHRKEARKMRNGYFENSTVLDKSHYSIPKIIVLNLCDPAGFQQVFAVVCIIFSWCAEFTFFYFLVNFIVMVYSLFGLLEKREKNNSNN